MSDQTPPITGVIPLSPKDNVADDEEGSGASIDRTYAMVQKFKAAPDTATGEANRTFVKNYLAYLQEKGLEDNTLNFKRYISVGIAAKGGELNAIKADTGDQVDDKGRPTTDVTANFNEVYENNTSKFGDDINLNLGAFNPEIEEYSYRDEITPLRAYRLASGTTTITYTYAEEKTREIEKKGSVVVNYKTEDGTELKAPYTDTPETVAEVVTEHYYVDANGQEVVVEDKTVRTPKNVAYNTKENETEKPQKLTDAAGNVYYLNEANTMTSVNDTETTSPAETGTVVEGVTKVTYIYGKAGSVIVNYKTEDGTPLAGTVVDEDGAGKTVESGAKDTDNGKPGSAYNTADNGMKPTRIKTAEGKVYELVPDLTEGEEEGEVESGTTKEVTYVYKEVKGNVVVKYEDTEGNTLADDEKDETDASLNVKYDTADHKKESIEKDGVKYYLTAKELKDGSKPATGDVVEGTTTVTYVYEKAGSVIVNYQTEDGTPLEGTADGANVASGAKDTTDAKAGTDYNTADNGMRPNRITTAEGKVYELVPTATKGDETGKVVAGETKEVTYVYKEVKGNVVVKYEDTEGNVIAEDEKDETDASLNVKYDTADHKKDEITKDGVKYYLTAKELKDGSKPATGDVVEGTTTVTYVYEKAGQVVVNYQTEDGTPLVGVDPAGANVASGAKDTVDGKPGSDYNTSDNGMKPARITTAEGKVYELVPTATKGDETGKVVAGETKEVTYVYKEVTGDVVVHYVDTEGNVIAEDKEDTKGASLNAKYDTTDNKPEKIEKDGTVYYLTEKALKDDSKPENGDVVEGKTEVTYVYEKAGQVVVHYTDEKGNTIQADAVDTKDGKPNADYNTADNDMKPNRITTPEGKVYELIPQSTKGDETGKVKAGETTEVTYVYKEITGNVVVHYVDTEGNTLAEDTKDVENGSLSEKYDTTDNKPAKLEKDGTVYYLTAKELKDGSKPENGAVVEGTTEITYVYEKAGNVLVHYVDEAGNTLQADAVDTKDGKPGAKYDTSDNDMKPTRITTPEGKVYELVPASTKGNETGDVEAGKTTEVTYVYKEVKGNVVVHYTDEAGNTIAEDVKDTTDGSVSSAYDTSDNKPATITTKDGKVYVLVPTATKGEESGKVTEGTTEVTYVYKDVKEEASKAIDKALSEKESKIKENPELTNEEKEKAIEDAKKDAEEAKKAIDKAPSKEEVEKAKENGKKEVEKDTPTPDKPSTPSENDKDQPTTPSPEEKAKAKEAIDKALENKVKKIDENPNLTPEQKEKAKEEAKKKAEEAKKTIDKAPSKEEVEKAKENGKKEVEKDTPTPDKPSTPSENDKDQPTTPSPEEKAKAKEAIDKALENKVKKIDENPNLTPEQKEKAKEEAKKDAEEAKKAIDKAPSKEEVEKAKENGKKEVEKDTPTPDSPSNPSTDNPSNPSTDNPTNPSEGDKDKPYTPSPEEKAKAKESVDKDLEEKIKNIDKDPNLTPEQKEKAKEEAKKEAEKVKKSIEEGKTTEWVDEKGNPIKPVTPGTYPAGSTPNYELVGTVTNKETGKVTHIFKPSTKKPVTVWVDVNGKPVKPLAEGDNPAGEIPGYALVETIKDEKTGNVIHVFKRTTNGGSLTPSQPGSPSTSSTNPTSPVKPTDSSQPTTPANPATPTMPSAPVNGKAPQAPAASSEAKGQAELPNTGTEDHASLAALGLLGVLSGFGLVARKKKED